MLSRRGVVWRNTVFRNAGIVKVLQVCSRTIGGKFLKLFGTSPSSKTDEISRFYIL